MTNKQLFKRVSVAEAKDLYGSGILYHDFPPLAVKRIGTDVYKKLWPYSWPMLCDHESWAIPGSKYIFLVPIEE